jgi:23S rRNA G2445 N2-methylase RlmL
MKALAISYKGMEDITALEIKELLKIDSSIKESCVVFDCSEEKLAEYCYKAQGVNRVLLLMDSFKIKDYKDLKRIEKIDFSKYLEGKKFAARAEVVESELNPREIEKTTGDYVDYKVDLDNPDITIFVYVYKKDCYVGIDFSGDVSKRSYKVFSTRDDVKGTIGYALVRLSGYDNKKTFLNLNAKSGTIAIEAALFGSGKSVNFYDKDKFLFNKFLKIDLSKFDKKEKTAKVYAFDSEGYQKVIEKNSQIAAVEIKFEEVEADCVVRYHNRKAEIKNLKKEREIKHGKEILKIATFLNP